MKTYLELEGKLGPRSRPQPQTPLQQTQLQPAQPSTNPMVRKASGPKASDKRKKTMIAKRRHKVRVLTQPTPSTPTSTAPAPTIATVSTQTPLVRPTAESIPEMVCKLATGQFAEVPHPTSRPQK